MLEMNRMERAELLEFARMELNRARNNYQYIKNRMKGKTPTERGFLLTPAKLSKKNLKIQVNRLNRLFYDKYTEIKL